jgi:hypothetical protein
VTEIDAVVRAYWSAIAAIAEGREWSVEEDEAYDLVDMAAMNDPEVAWRYLDALVASAADANALGVLGAGPIEDILRYHGRTYAVALEERALRDPRWREALTGAWGWEELDPDVRDRLLPTVFGQADRAPNDG